MLPSFDALPPGKKLFFASDFHLGVPNPTESLLREKKLVAWLDHIAPEAHMIFLLGDLFDFWFEYKQVIPKGFIRFQGKLAELRDRQIPIVFFTGNHDMWMFDYFPKELGIPVYREPQSFSIGSHQFLIGHGDGLGPGDQTYKILKWFFNSRLCQWLFARFHPNFGLAIAHYWSGKSRINNLKLEESFSGKEREFLYQYCLEQESKQHRDFYIFGHRHLPLAINLGENSMYFNLGEWVHRAPYAEYDGQKIKLKEFETP